MDEFISVWHGGSLYEAQAKKDIKICSRKRCHSDVTETNYNTCEKCRYSQSSFRIRKRKRKYDSGECSICEQPRREDRVTCVDCGLKQSKRQQGRDRLKRKTTHRHFCLDCFKVAPVHGRTRCRKCLIDNAERSQKRRLERLNNGFCNRCGGDRGEKPSICQKCIDRMRLKRQELRQSRVNAGVCIVCAQPSIDRTCNYCSAYLAESKRDRYKKKC